MLKNVFVNFQLPNVLFCKLLLQKILLFRHNKKFVINYFYKIAVNNVFRSSKHVISLKIIPPYHIYDIIYYMTFVQQNPKLNEIV